MLDEADPLLVLEGILELGTKASTYKYALIRAITDYLIENPVQEQGSTGKIPLSWIALKWIDYYWPLTIHHKNAIPQAVQQKGKRDTLTQAYIEDYQRKIVTEKLPVCSYPPTIVQNEFGWFHIREHLERGYELDKNTSRLIVNIRRVILDQPIRYISNIQGNRADIFGLFFKEETDYERSRLESMNRETSKNLRISKTFFELLQNEPANLVIYPRTYETLSKMRFWIKEAVLSKWVLYCENQAEKRGMEPISPLKRLVEIHEKRRAATSHYRQLYSKFEDLKCAWCGTKLHGTWDVDHILPWSRFPVNAFWNLVPSCSKCNRGSHGKFNRIIQWSHNVEDVIRNHIKRCLDLDSALVSNDMSKYRYHTGKEPVIQSLTEHIESIYSDLSKIVMFSQWIPPIDRI